MGAISPSCQQCLRPVLSSLLTRTDSKHSLTEENTPIHISAADPSLQLTVSGCRALTHSTSAALRKHFGIGAQGPGKDIVSVISTGHYLLPTLFYGVIGAEGVFSAASAASTAGELSKQIVQAGSKILVTCEATREVAVRAAEEAGWGANGGGRVVLMSEDASWTLRVVQGDGSLSPNLVNSNEKLEWQRITDRTVLENSLVVLIYSSGTTGLPKGIASPPFSPLSFFETDNHRRQTLACQPRRRSRYPRRHVQVLAGHAQRATQSPSL